MRWQTSAMDIRAPSKELGRTAKGSSRRWGRVYDNRGLFPLFGVSDYESLLARLARLAEMADDRTEMISTNDVWHQLPDELELRAESFYRDVPNVTLVARSCRGE